MWYSLISVQHSGDTGEITATVTTDTTSRWYAGHFPGNPVLPGIAQLAMLGDIVSSVHQRKAVIRHISRVKFRNLIKPGDRLDIRLNVGNEADHYHFHISCGQERISSGSVYITLNNATSSS